MCIFMFKIHAIQSVIILCNNMYKKLIEISLLKVRRERSLFGIIKIIYLIYTIVFLAYSFIGAF